eukprot:COSAG04_NODE_384_length_15390_cov_64.570158_2_plen_127_part_00
MTSGSTVCNSSRASFPTTSTKHCITSGLIVRSCPYLCSHVLDHISPIFPPLFLVFCAFSPPGRDGSNVVARAGVETQSKLQVCTTEKKASCTDLHMSVTLSPPPPPPLPPPPPPSRRQRQAAGKSE